MLRARMRSATSATRCSSALHQRAVVVAASRRPKAFVTLDADQPRGAHWRARAAPAPRLLVAAAAGASAVQADFQQHFERGWCRLALRQAPGLDQVQLRDRIDEEDHARAGMLAQQRGHGAQVRRRHHLVGDQHAARARGQADTCLRHVGEGHAPGARLQLRGKELWRHRRLAMRRQLDALIASELLHPAQVAGQRVALDHRQRQRHVAAQHVPLHRGDGRTAHAARHGAGSP